ncbi:MAG: glutathione S-transferase [Hyphomicrobiales bacterium]|nr:glutathione S-transferase [Hyphomicrobiales bacterium]
MSKGGKKGVLTISSRNYSSWSLRGWLICRLAGLEVTEKLLSADDPSARAELLHLSPSFLVPKLSFDGLEVWDVLAIAEFLNDELPDCGLLPSDMAQRAHCRAVSGEMHQGFVNLRSALPMNMKAKFSNFRIWAGAQGDIDRIQTIWRNCLAAYGGPFLFGKTPTLADAMYAPVCSRFATYDVKLDSVCAAYRDTILGLPEIRQWAKAASEEPEDLEELDVEF